MDRRNFIKTTAFLGGSYSLMKEQSFAGLFLPKQQTLSSAMRWAQLVFTENDPGHYDPDFWLAYFKRVRAEGVLLSAGGVVAFYPTNIPLHHRSEGMGNTDPLGYLIEGCRKMNMAVVLRTDPHAVRQDVYDAHPDWIAVTPQNEKQRHWADPSLWVACSLGPYNFDFMTAVHREIMERYQPDGIFSNRWSGPWAYTGMCYCSHCLKNFKDFSGLDIPRSNKLFDESTRLDPVYIQYRKWSTNRLRELWLHWDEVMRKIKPTSTFLPNGFPDKLVIGEESKAVFSDMQMRFGAIPPWANGKGAKEHRATMGMKPLINIFSVAASGPGRWMDSVQSDAELRVWAADGVANGMRPCFVKFGGLVQDKRWLDTIANLYTEYARHEKYLKNLEPIARVGVLTRENNRSANGEVWQKQGEDQLSGIYHALVEGRIPFEMVHPDLLDEIHLRAFKLLILADITSLSDRQCDQLRNFVAQGGSIVATFETSLYDENNKRKNDFGLSDLLGVSYAGRVEGPLDNSYLRLKKDEETHQFHPVLQGLETANRIQHGRYRIQVNPKMDFPHPVTFVPPYPSLPMEELYPRVADTDIPELYLREIKGARIAYFPWDIGRIFWQLMTPDHLQLLLNTIKWTLDEAPLIAIEGVGTVDTAIWRQEKSMTVHLVNLTNPMMMRGTFREVIPIKVKVRVNIPEGVQVRQVKLLMAGQVLAHNIKEGMIEIGALTLADHEIIAIDFSDR